MENNNQENETNHSKFKTVSNPGNYKAVEEILFYHSLVELLDVQLY